MCRDLQICPYMAGDMPLAPYMELSIVLVKLWCFMRSDLDLVDAFHSLVRADEHLGILEAGLFLCIEHVVG